LACHLFDKERLTLGQAAAMAGMNRTAFEDELHERRIPIYRYDVEDFELDLKALKKMKEQGL
jgi:predicted HTH domain antitoxin